MSDPDMHDPLDDAYLRAEALLADDRDRAARRERVLAAAAEAAPEVRAAQLRRGPHPGWAAAAAVMVVGVALAVSLPRAISPSPAPAPSSALLSPAIAPPAVSAPAPPSPTTEPSEARLQARRAAPIQAPDGNASGAVAPFQPPSFAAEPSPAAAPTPAPLPLPQVQAPVAAAKQVSAGLVETPAPAPPPVAAQAKTSTQDAQYARSRRAASSDYAARPALDDAERMRRAAASGRTEEVEAFLAQGVPVDAADADGNTALMESVRFDHPATAALLSRHGASPDRTNAAGESATTLAASGGDPKLARVLRPPR